MSTGSTLTTTSYAILGLLAVQPWSTYELTRQMDRSLGRIWPRAQSKLYEEPKKLVDKGLVEALCERVGQRPRTVYRITPEGRQALAHWLQQPAQGPVLECEQLLKIFFAEHGTKTDALSTLDATRAWAKERNEGNLAAARAYLAGEGLPEARGPDPARGPVRQRLLCHWSLAGPTGQLSWSKTGPTTQAKP
jgi:DNA-binding PadR family transcriptional regulator